MYDCNDEDGYIGDRLGVYIGIIYISINYR